MDTAVCHGLKPNYERKIMLGLFANFAGYTVNNIQCTNDGDMSQLFICKELLEKGLSQDVVCVDIGAYVGGWTSMISVLTGTKVPIYVYEPSYQHFTLLEKNCGTIPNVLLHNYGIGTEDAEVKLILTGGGGHVQSPLDDLSHCGNVETVVTKQFNIRQPIHIMKIDVDGYECKLLPALYPFLPLINSLICEVNIFEFASSKEDCLTIAEPILEKLMSHYPYTYGLSRHDTPFCVKISKENIAEWCDEHFDRHLSTDILFSQCEITSITKVNYARNAWYA